MSVTSAPPTVGPRTDPGTARLALPRAPGIGRRAATGLVLLLLLALPLYASDYYQGLIVLGCIYAVVTVSWNLVLGYGGLFTFGQMAFFAVGAYTTALLTTKAGVPPWIGLGCGVIAAAGAGALIGVPSLRLYGPYMVLFTLAFQLILQILLTTDTSGTFGGSFGLPGIEPLTLPGIDEATADVWIAVAMLALTVGAIGWLLRTPVGVAVRSLKESEDATVARGVGRTAHRVLIFVVSAAFTGMAGAYFAHYYGVITPSVLDLGLLVQLLAMIIIGGAGSTAGVVGGTFLLVWLGDRLATHEQYSALLWGAIIVVAVLLLPGGLAGTARRLRDRLGRHLDEWLDGEDDGEGIDEGTGTDQATVAVR